MQDPRNALRDLWLAWQGGSLDGRDPEVTAKKQRFIAVMEAATNCGVVAPAGLEDLVALARGSRNAMLAFVASGAPPAGDGYVELYRGIADAQALTALQSLALGGTWLMPANSLMSFSLDEQVAGGFAWKSAWGGLAFRCRIPIAEAVFAPQVIWLPSENLDREAEVLFRLTAAVKVVVSDVICVTKAPQYPTTEIHMKLALREQLADQFERWMGDSGLSHASLARKFKGYGLG